MGKIYTAHYTNTQPTSTTINAGLQYQTGTVAPSGFRAAITIAAGNLRCVRVPFLHEGFLSQFVVKQSGGTGVAFVVELLMSVVPFPVGEAPVATAATGTIELFRVLPQQSAISGAAVDITPDNEIGWAFKNADGDYTNNQRYLYLVIKPTAAGGSTSWDAFLMAHSNNYD
jgi:hypothetical protein